jgi:hypothetical protein
MSRENFCRRQKHGRDQKANSDVIDNVHSRTLLRPLAAVPMVSAVNPSDGGLFGVCSSLKRRIWNIRAKNFLVSFGLSVHPTIHGIPPL